MWVMALRAFDDVKESVRSAAAGLLRSLRGLSLRLMDRQQTPAAGEQGQGGDATGCAGVCARGGGGLFVCARVYVCVCCVCVCVVCVCAQRSIQLLCWVGVW